MPGLSISAFGLVYKAIILQIPLLKFQDFWSLIRLIVWNQNFWPALSSSTVYLLFLLTIGSAKKSSPGFTVRASAVSENKNTTTITDKENNGMNIPLRKYKSISYKTDQGFIEAGFIEAAELWKSVLSLIWITEALGGQSYMGATSPPITRAFQPLESVSIVQWLWNNALFIV